MSHSVRVSLVLLAASLVGSCASVTTSVVALEESVSGLTYFLPQKLIKVTYTVAKDARPVVNIEPTPAIPDSQHRFVASFSRNYAGKNELNVAVNSSGLLTTGNSTTTSQVADVLKEAAASFGALGTFAVSNTPLPSADCAAVGTYSTIFRLSDFSSNTGANTIVGTTLSSAQSFCQLTIEVAKLIGGVGETKQISRAQPIGLGTSVAGFYYRSVAPFLVTVTRKNSEKERFIVILPDESSTNFLPVERALFANAKAEFVFTDGIATTYKQDAESELLGIAKIPAAVLAGYFAAAGKAFTDRQTVVKNESLFDYERARSVACATALAAKNLTDAEKHCK